MTMHMVKGMSSLNTKKRRAKKKTTSILAEEEKTRKLLDKLGYTPNSGHRYTMPSYSSPRVAPTSDLVGNGFATVRKQYTGDEIVGIGTLHKSNMVPIRKDSNAAKEIATMRRN